MTLDELLTMPFETPSRRSPCEEVSFEYLANQQTGCKAERRSLFSSSRRRCPQFIPHNHLKRTALSSFRFLLSSFLSKFELQPSNGHIQTYSKFELLPSKQHDSVVLRLSAKKIRTFLPQLCLRSSRSFLAELGLGFMMRILLMAFYGL